jgi:dephospho-CoA kinase
MTLIIGITGGIGSGKSTVCKIFRLLRVPVFEADMVGRYLLETDEKLKDRVSELFGGGILTPGGTVDRKKLSKIVFNDEDRLKKLNELVHPAVKEKFIKWKNKRKHCPYVVHEAAILFESGFHEMMDYTIIVTAPEDQRIERVMRRDGESEPHIKARMQKQYSEDYKKQLVDFILPNDNSRLIIPEIIKIDNNIKKYGKIR